MSEPSGHLEKNVDHKSEKNGFEVDMQMIASVHPYANLRTTLYECFVGFPWKKGVAPIRLCRSFLGYVLFVPRDPDNLPSPMVVREIEVRDLGDDQLCFTEIKKVERGELTVKFLNSGDFKYFSKMLRTMIDAYKNSGKKELEEEEEEGEEDDDDEPIAVIEEEPQPRKSKGKGKGKRNSTPPKSQKKKKKKSGFFSGMSEQVEEFSMKHSLGISEHVPLGFTKKPFTEWDVSNFVDWIRCVFVQRVLGRKIATLFTILDKEKDPAGKVSLLRYFKDFFNKNRTMQHLYDLIHVYEDASKHKKLNEKYKYLGGSAQTIQRQNEGMLYIIKINCVRSVLKFEIAMMKANQNMFFTRYYHVLRKKVQHYNKYVRLLMSKGGLQGLKENLLGTSLRSVWDGQENRDNIFSFLLFTKSLDDVIGGRVREFYDWYIDRCKQLESEEEKKKQLVCREDICKEIDMEQSTEENLPPEEKEEEEGENNNNNVHFYFASPEEGRSDFEILGGARDHKLMKIRIFGRDEVIKLKKERYIFSRGDGRDGMRDHYNSEILRPQLQYFPRFLKEYNETHQVKMEDLSLVVHVEKLRYRQLERQKREIRRLVDEKYQRIERLTSLIHKKEILIKSIEDLLPSTKEEEEEDVGEEGNNNNNKAMDDLLKKKNEMVGKLKSFKTEIKALRSNHIEFTYDRSLNINFSDDVIMTDIFPQFAFGKNKRKRRAAIENLIKNEISKVSKYHTKKNKNRNISQEQQRKNLEEQEEDLVALKTKIVISKRISGKKNKGVGHLESYGMRLLGDTIKFGPYHASILIGNVNFNWYSDGTVHMRHLSDTKHYEDIVSIDGFSPLVLSNSSATLWDVIQNIANEVVLCNTNKTYSSWNKFDPNSMNCQEFSMKMLSILGYRDFEGVTKKYIENLKNFKGATEGETLRILKLSHCPSDFKKNFKKLWVKKRIIKKKKKKKKKKNDEDEGEIVEEEEEEEKIDDEEIWNKKKKQLEFRSHSALDKFYYECIKVDLQFPCRYPTIYRLLKGFDRAFGMMYLHKKHSSVEEEERSLVDMKFLEPSSAEGGCPFEFDTEFDEENVGKLCYSKYFEDRIRLKKRKEIKKKEEEEDIEEEEPQEENNEEVLITVEKVLEVEDEEEEVNRGKVKGGRATSVLGTGHPSVGQHKSEYKTGERDAVEKLLKKIIDISLTPQEEYKYVDHETLEEGKYGTLFGTPPKKKRKK